MAVNAYIAIDVLTLARSHFWLQQIFGDRGLFHQKECQRLRLLMDQTVLVEAFSLEVQR
jgi:hypothetical protein